MKFSTGGIVRERQRMNRRNSGTDGIARMKEETRALEQFISGAFFLF